MDLITRFCEEPALLETLTPDHDWSFFSVHPMRKKLTEAFKQNPAEDVRRFALPYQKARSEHKFYFETWQPSAPSLPDYIEEV